MSDERDTADDSTRFTARPGQADETRFTGVGAPPPAGVGPSHTTFPPGSLIGHTYRIEALLARGGMGEVYRASHSELNTEHALKIILPELANNQRIVDLFRREASVLRTIRHDAVVAYDGVFRDENGRLYLVMEFVDGPSLSKLMGKRTFTGEEIRQLRDRLADGLAVAHDKGVIHRDISPDNVILPGGDVAKAKIIDFGISKMADPEQKTIIGEDFAGKFSYVSPEQLGMFEGKVDGRSDIYSLGLVLVAAAQGEPLDMGQSPISVIEARRAVPDLSRVPADVRADLAVMLEPDPAKRAQSMRELMRPQEQRGGRRTGAAVPPRRSSDAKQGSGRMAVILGLVAILVVAGGGGGYWYWQKGSQDGDTTKTNGDAQQSGGGTASTGEVQVASTTGEAQNATSGTSAQATGAGGNSTQQAVTGTESVASTQGGTAGTTTETLGSSSQAQQANGSTSAATTGTGQTSAGTTFGQQQSSDGSQSNATTTAGDQTATNTQTTDAATSDGASSNAGNTVAVSGTTTAAGTAATTTQTALLPLVPDVAKLRSDAEQAVQGLQCAGVRVDVADTGDMRAAGYVASQADRDKATARLGALQGAGRVDNAVVVMARPLCDVLDVLRTNTSFDRGLFALDPGGTAAVYREGDHIQVTVTPPPGFGYLYVDYIDATERYVIHLLPNSNFRPDNRITGGQQVVIGSLRQEYDAYKIQPPFGANLIIAIASRKPLFTGMRDIQEGIDQYLPALRSSLAAQAGADVTSQYAGVLLKAP